MTEPEQPPQSTRAPDSAPQIAPLNQPEQLLTLRARVAEVMVIDQAQPDPNNNAVMFLGKLKIDSSIAYETLTVRLKEIGYFALLRDIDNDPTQNEAQRHVFITIKGDNNVVVKTRPWVNLLLFIATFASTAFAGALFSRSVFSNSSSSFSWSDIVSYGLPFAVTLLGVLGVHELGHYVFARKHKLPVTLPFFIPMPIGLGTLGAFIQMRGMPRDKRALFDVGLAGPIAGLLVAIPLYVVGLLMAETTSTPAPATRAILMEQLIAIFRPDAVNVGILFNPVLYAARVGLVITMLNLLPVGQLDGGHIAYAALGRKWARWIAYATLAIMAILGFTVSSNWLIWLLFASMGGGARHAPAMDDVTPLGIRRNVIFIAAVILFLSLFTARPF